MSDRRRRPRADPLDNWVPKTQLGRMVFEGQISSIYEIFEEGYRIKEVEIIDVLLPDLRDDVLDINLVQKQTDAGERSSFRAIVAVGNGDGLIGLGLGKARRGSGTQSSTSTPSGGAVVAGSATAENPTHYLSRFRARAAAW